jgi:hypothetical protein
MAMTVTAQIFVQTIAGVNVGELVNAELTDVTWELNSPGSAKFTMRSDDPQVSTPLLGVHEAKIVISDGTTTRWFVGPIQTADSTPNRVTFAVEGLEAYFRDRIVDDATLEYTSIDQNSIAVNLVNFAQSEATQANRDMNIDIGSFTLSGDTRSRRYERNDHQEIFDLLNEFPDLDDGFDWAVEPLPNGVRNFMCYNPQRGVFLSEIAFEWDAHGTRNLKDFKVDESALALATHTYATGGTNGSIKFEANVEDPAKSALYKVRQRVISEGSQKDVVWLQDKATKHIALHGQPEVVPQLKAIESPSNIVLAVQPGDSAKVRIQSGRININATYRFTSVSWKPKEDVVELKVNLA